MDSLHRQQAIGVPMTHDAHLLCVQFTCRYSEHKGHAVNVRVTQGKSEIFIIRESQIVQLSNVFLEQLQRTFSDLVRKPL